MEQVREFFERIPRALYLPIGLGCIGLILFGYGFGVFLQNNSQKSQNEFVDVSHASVEQNSASKAASLGSTFAVDVEGAVASPGVYHVAKDSRVQDALVAAGGLGAAADRGWVAQHINLATKLLDGMKIYIPRVGEIVAAQSSVDSTNVLGAQTQQVDINSASESDLDALPGIGPVTAQKIISGRPYSSVQDLLTKKVVSQSVFGKIKDLVVAQ